MKTLAKYHVCNRCVIGEKTFQNILIGPGKLPLALGKKETFWLLFIQCLRAPLGLKETETTATQPN